MEVIQQLLELQKLDIEIDAIRKDAQVFPDRVTASRQSEEQIKKALSTVQGKIKTLEGEIEQSTAFLEQENTRLAKSQTRIKQLKTPYEFQALQREIENTKRSNTELEETLLKKSLELEALKKVAADEEAKYVKAQEELKGAEGEAQSKLGEFEGVLKVKSEEQLRLKTTIDKALLSKYLFIRNRRYQDALVAISNGACGGCFVNIPPQMLNHVLRTREIIQCPNCARLIYLA